MSVELFSFEFYVAKINEYIERVFFILYTFAPLRTTGKSGHACMFARNEKTTVTDCEPT